MKIFCLIRVLILALMVPMISHAAMERRTALVIGNTLYSKAPLGSPSKDADTIAETLEKCNFIVQKESNLKHEDMRRVIAEFPSKNGEAGGVGFFYFAGHAVQVDGKNYLIPIDAVIKGKEDIEQQGLSLSWVLTQMNASGTRVNIVLLDAAYTDPFEGDFTPHKPGLSAIEPPDGFLIISATMPGSTVSDRSGRSSIFTAAVASGLLTPDFDIGDAFVKAEIDVSKATNEKQTPWSVSTLEGFPRLYTPELDFSLLLYDIKQFVRIRDAATTASSKTDIWLKILKMYPKWSADIDTMDPADLIIAAMDKELNVRFLEMTQSFHIHLSKTNSTGMKFVYIPPGEFTMGSPFDEPGRGKDENQRTVTISRGFFMQATEVTQGQWEAVMGSNPSTFDECGPDCPVESVSIQDIENFIKELNALEAIDTYRIPTEMEWEYATRAGGTDWFYFGIDPSKMGEYAWYRNNSNNRSHPVAQKKPNGWGLFDIHGNVWEWCRDREGDYHVVRGGSWHNPLIYARSANRFFVFPHDRNYTVGFRLVRSAVSRKDKKIGIPLDKTDRDQ